MPECPECLHKLSEAPECPGCGLEPEVLHYYRCAAHKVRVGYACRCGAVIIKGVVQALMGAGA